MHPKKQIQNGKSAQGLRTIRLEKIIPAAALLTILGLAAPDPTRMDGAYTEQPRSEEETKLAFTARFCPQFKRGS